MKISAHFLHFEASMPLHLVSPIMLTGTLLTVISDVFLSSSGCDARHFRSRGEKVNPHYILPPPFFYPSVSVLTFLVGFPWRTPRACWPAWTGFHGERWWECCGCHHAVWNTHIMTGMLLRNQTNLRSETCTWSKNSTIYYPKVWTTHVTVTALQSRNTIKQPNSKTLAVVEVTLPTLYHASTNRQFWAASRLSTSAFQEHHD